MNNRDRYLILRSKKLGLILADLREKKRVTVSECAQAMSVSDQKYLVYENGEQCPNLPELEGLAFLLDEPLEAIFGSQLHDTPINRLDQQSREKLSILRNKKIAAILKQARIKADYSYEGLSSKTGISSIILENYEKSEFPIPVSDLELLAKELQISMDIFLDRNSMIGAWRTREELKDQVNALPDELLEFVSEPVNRPYLDLARKLSNLSVERLRAVAEGLLEITY